MDNKIDKAIASYLKPLAVSVAIAGILAAPAVQAEYRAYRYFENYGFDEEIGHCANLLQRTMAVVDGEQAEYVIEDVRLHGPWYRFEMVASVYGSDGEALVDGYKVRCKANRWIESARLIERSNSPEVSSQLLARNTNELLRSGSQALASNTVRN